MMSKSIYLFKEHENFHAGKTKLQKPVIFRTNIYWISLRIACLLILIWLGGIPLRQSFYYQQVEQTTTGTLRSCDYSRNSRNRNVASVYYDYVVNEQAYTAKDLHSLWKRCENFVIGQEITVYYLSDNPDISQLRSFISQRLIILMICLSVLGLFGLFACLPPLAQNRQERLRYARFKRADTVLEATVTKARDTFIDYSFFSPDKDKLHGRIERGMQYAWSEQIEQDDILYILYLDNQTYCVL
jgi:hypothetical protein